MSRKLELTPRKVPRQGRAKATVDAILEATRRLLLRDGYQSVTTNHVAELAGTSIGTLYQYFPSIDSLCTSLYAALKEDLNTRLGVAVGQLGAGSVAQAPPRLVDCFLSVYGEEADLHHILCDIAPDIGAIRKVKAIDEQSVQLLADYLTSNAVADAATRAALLFSALDGMSQAAVVRDPTFTENGTVRDVMEKIAKAALSA